jgi:Peptidase family C25/Secretion system C-terminal sorting domain
MKKQYLFCFFLTFFWCKISLAQQRFANEWIQPNQEYLKITINESGVYRITGAELEDAGWNLATINSFNLQLFHHGKEIELLLSNYTNPLKSTDFIEFFADKNTGEQDSLLYRPNAARANPYYSIFSDETAYFLTIGTKSGKHMHDIETTASSQTPETFHLEEQVHVLTLDNSFNNAIGLVPLLQQSYYEEGEGRTGKFVSATDSASNYSISLKNWVQTSSFLPKISFRINGRSRVFHNLTYQFEGEAPSDTFLVLPFGVRDITHTPVAISSSKINFSLTSTQKIPLDWYSLSFIKITYPQKIDMDGKLERYFYLAENPLGRTKLSFENNPPLAVYDITDKTYIFKYNPYLTSDFTIYGTTKKRILFATSTFRKVLNISPVKFKKYDEKPYNYLLITDESLSKSVNEYAVYRSTQKGGGFMPLVVFTKDLYDQFSYGEKTPLALRRFVDYMLQKEKNMHLFLVGRGMTFPDELRSNRYPSLVPSMGYPASDVLLTAGLNGNTENVAGVPTGRLNVTKNEEVTNYFEKVKEFEAIDPTVKTNEWRKRILHISGGQTLSEIKSLMTILEDVSETATEGLLGGEVKKIVKKAAIEVEKVSIAKEVNEGVGFISYAGHGSASTLDLDFGFCSPPQNGFQNKGKYPLMFFNGCGVGNIFFRYNTLSTDWLLTPNKGAIAVLANSFWSYATPTQAYLKALYQQLFDDPQSGNLTLGQIQVKVLEELEKQSGNDYVKANMHQVILQGDPALKVFQLKLPDFSVNNRSVFVRGQNSFQPIEKNDSLQVGVVISNLGKYDKNENLTLKISEKNKEIVLFTQVFKMPSVAFKDTLLFIVPKKDKLISIEVVLDEGNEIAEYSEKNNTTELVLSEGFEKESEFPVDFLVDKIAPFIRVEVDGRIPKNSDFISQSPVIKVIVNDNVAVDSSKIELLWAKCLTCDFEKIPTALSTVFVTSSQEISVQFLPQLLLPSTYKLLCNATDKAGNSLQKPYEIELMVAEKDEPISISVFPNPTEEFVQIRYSIRVKTSVSKAIVSIFDTKGNLIEEQTQQPHVGENVVYWNRKEQPAGSYFVKVIVGEATFQQRIMIK